MDSHRLYAPPGIQVVAVRIAFDCRSALSPRTTGWERYARELWNRLSSDPETVPWGRGTSGIGKRLLSDLAMPLRTADVAHFPTYPPVPGSGGRHRTFLTVHDLTWWNYPETASRLGLAYYKPLAERAIQRCSLVVHSATVKAEVCAQFGVSASRVHVVHPGVALRTPIEERLLPRRLRPRGYLLAVASVEPRKNLTKLADAHRRWKLRADFPLVVVGRQAWGHAPAGIDHISDADDDALTALYLGAAGVVSPSLYEGFGLPVLEAMALGTKVACSDIPVYREVAGCHAIYFDPRSLESIADALTRLVESDAPTAASVAHAQRYSWDTASARLAALYRKTT